LIRNIMMAALYVHDHVVHFYHLHSLDWVDIVNALKADPKKAAELAALFCWSHWKMRTHRADRRGGGRQSAGNRYAHEAALFARLSAHAHCPRHRSERPAGRVLHARRNARSGAVRDQHRSIRAIDPMQVIDFKRSGFL
jgi:hypothetical protein